MNFESILLNKLIHDGEYFGKATPILKPTYFQSVGNQEFFKLIKEYYTNYNNIPTLTEVVSQVKNVPNEEIRAQIVSELQAIAKIETVDNTEFMLDETVKFVKDAIFTEALILGSDGITEKSDDKKLKSKMLMEEMSKVSIDSDLGLDFEDIDSMIEYYQQKQVGVRTQHDEFNKRLGAGFLPKTLSIIMAASGVGKSLLMTDLLSGQIKEGKNVLLVSLEMQDKEVMKRVHANALDLDINELRNYPEEVIRNAHKAKKDTIGKLFVKEYPVGTFSALMLDQLIDSYRVEKGITFDVVYVDYLGIMKSDLLSPSAGLYSYIKSIVEEVRAIAVKQELPIISASQLNRSAVNNTEASNDSVSDSIGSIMTADFIVFLLQNEQMKEENIITAKVTKNRFTGRTDQWDMNIDYSRMRFEDLLVQTPGAGMSEQEVNTTIVNTVKQDMDTIKKNDMSNSEFGEDDIMSQLGL